MRLGRSLVCSLALLVPPAAADGLDSTAHSDRDEISQPSEADEKPGPTMNIRGRVYANYETINLPHPAVNGSRVSEFDIRRADLTIGGFLWEDLGYRFKADAGTGELNIQDLTISYDAGLAIISVGQLGPIDELTVPAYREFMEGSAIEDAFAPDNQIGVSVLRESETWTFAAGIFKGAIDPGEAEEGWTYASRVTFAPQLPEGRLLHLGSYFSWRKGEDGEAIYGYGARSLLRTGERYVDTDAIADEDMLFGMELAGSVGSVSLESQCAVVRASVVSQRESTAHFDGCYAAWLWFVTGETRNYSDGGFSMVDVQKPLFEGGLGAWQAGIRYDSIDLNDGNVLGGRQNGWTFVLNWYLSNRFWLATNYSRTDLEYAAATPDTTDGMAVRVHYQIRW